jgi:DNA-binding NarL/FixJ family response regulator
MGTEEDAVPPTIRVLIVDDHAVVREGIRHVLSSDGGFDVVGEASGGVAAIELAKSLKPDVMVLDLTMPDIHGLEVAEHIRKTMPETAILILSIHDHPEYVLRSIQAGTQGYLRKDSSPTELRNAIRAVHEGDTFFGTDEPSQASSESLTPRERRVLVEIARGHTNKEIAGTLGVSVRTVESHRESLLRKLGVKGTAGLTRYAIGAGLLTL